MEQNLFHSKLSNIYSDYTKTIKPLIADIEARYQNFPDSLFNEIRALNDHIARCYNPEFTDEQIEIEIKKAESHVLRITFDCYKYLDVWFHDFVKKIDKEYTSKIDITLIDNGLFAPKFREIQSDCIKIIREAKKAESVDKQRSFNLYQQAYNSYSELEDLINSNISKLNWAKCRRKARWILTVFIWIVSVIISSIITIFIGCDEIISCINRIFP
jgi:hypothetical protein